MTSSGPMHRLLIDQDATGEPYRPDGPEAYAAHPVLALADAHRRRRGPYTGGGDLLRQIAPALLTTQRDLLQRHDVEIRVMAPELRDLLPGTRETLPSTVAVKSAWPPSQSPWRTSWSSCRSAS